MRSFVPAYELVPAKTLERALDMVGEDWRPFAGGTDLMVLFEAGKLPHKKFVSIWALPELRGIDVTAEHITLGALTTFTDVQRHPVLRDEFPLLVQAASETGGIATQNRGTLGGNIVNASPAADSPPALMVYDAELELTSRSGSRWVPYDTFHRGYKQIILRPSELVARIRMPRRHEYWRQYYRKVGTRQAQAISKICFAAAATMDKRRVRIALGSVAPTVIRCYQTEGAIGRDPNGLDAAKDALAREIAPINDIRSTSDYRLRVAQNLLGDFLHANGKF